MKRILIQLIYLVFIWVNVAPTWALTVTSRNHCEPLVLNTLNTDSFGPLASVFQCDVTERDPANERRPDNNSHYGRTTAFWAQELIGADLARDAMTQWKSEGTTTRPVNIGVVDTGYALNHFPESRYVGMALQCRRSYMTCNPHLYQYEMSGVNLTDLPDDAAAIPQSCPEIVRDCPNAVTYEMSHGTQVNHLLFGSRPLSSSEDGRIAYLSTLFEQYDTRMQRYNATSPRPTLFNASVQCPFHMRKKKQCKGGIEFWKKLAQRSMVVKCAGNYYPEPTGPDNASFGGILVGSIAPNGMRSAFSQEGPALTIMAPSDFSLASNDVTTTDDKIETTGISASKFAKTSGATPLVTSALTNVQALLPGINTIQAKALLKNTAIKTGSHTPDNGRNGVGALNSYKLAMVSKRLKDAGWPSESAMSLLNDTSLYDFSSDVNRLVARAQVLMQTIPTTLETCNQHKEAFKLLRQAYFLAPSNTILKRELSDIYASNGMQSMADYVDPSRRSNREKILDIGQDRLRLRMLIRNNQFTSDDEELLLRNLQSGNMINMGYVDLNKLYPQHTSLLARVFSQLTWAQKRKIKKALRNHREIFPDSTRPLIRLINRNH